MTHLWILKIVDDRDIAREKIYSIIMVTEERRKRIEGIKI